MADGELTAREAERVVWDVIVVGTGMGGGMLGYRLARSGPQGAVRREGALDTARSAGDDSLCDARTGRAASGRSAEAYYDALARAGRSTDEIEDISGRFPKRFVPFIGSGTGGSSALYGMVCERFFARDFTPRQNFPDPGDSTVPDAWPVSYEQMAALVRGGGEAAGGSRSARSAAPGGGRGRVCPRRRHFRQTTSRWSTIWRVADCIPITCRWPVITPTVVPPVRPTSATSRAKTMPPATACCRPLPSTAPTCWPNVGSCAWTRTARRSGK